MILAGLSLAKYDQLGLKKLGFDSFTEAFNVIGYALGGRPASVKNYRDEFDPFFPNPRKGWHKRTLRDHCRKMLETFQDTDLESFASLVRSFAGYDDRAWSEVLPKDEVEPEDSSFAKRLITGLAAEQYFVFVQPTLPQFQGYTVENTTRPSGKTCETVDPVEVCWAINEALQALKASGALKGKKPGWYHTLELYVAGSNE